MIQCRVKQSRQITCIFLLAASFVSIFPDSPVLSGLAGAFLAFLAYHMLDDADDDIKKKKTGADEGGGEEKKPAGKQPWENTVYIAVFVFRALLYDPLLRWLLGEGATWADCGAAAVVFAVVLEACFVIVYRIKLRPGGQWEKLSRSGYFLAPVLLSAAAVLPRYYFLVRPAVVSASLYPLALQYAVTALLLLPLMLCFRRGERSGVTKAGAALMILAAGVSAAAMFAVYAGVARLPMEQILLVAGGVNITVMVVWKHIYHTSKDEERQKFIGRLGLHTFIPLAVYYIVSKWGHQMEGFGIFACIIGTAIVYLLAIFIIGNDEIKASGTQAKNKPQASPTYFFSDKTCGRCGKSVPSNMRAGMKCPHCGVIWGNERTVYRN